jgi:hypothetical protein
MLHITNGDLAAAVFKKAALPGQFLPWRDVLHEGPVPAGLSLEELSQVRARFIAGQGWGDAQEVEAEFSARDRALLGHADHDEVVLWFEHDLFDQLQLLQLLDWFSSRDLQKTQLSLVCGREYLGTISPERATELFCLRKAVSPAQLDLGRDSWEAFTGPDPRRLMGVIQGDTSPLPFLKSALQRHLQEFPSVRNGLSRSEAQALQAFSAGAEKPRQAFLEVSEKEAARFLGDIVFASYLERLSQGPHPLLVFEDGSPISTPRGSPGFWSRSMRLTGDGHAVLEGKADLVRINGIRRWLGGAHLFGKVAAWRWNERTMELEGARVTGPGE